MKKTSSMEEYEARMLALPIAGKVSGEDKQHEPGDVEYDPILETGNCRCDRCKIIRIKRRRAFRFPRTKCPKCGQLFVSALYRLCEACR